MINCSMKCIFIIFILFFSVSFTQNLPSAKCTQFLKTLEYNYKHNKTQCIFNLNLVNSTIFPYLVDSGKIIDDMGFPGQCQKNKQNLYSTVRMKVNANNN